MLRRLPNLLTSLRIAAIPAMCWLAVTDSRDAFGLFVMASLAADVTDGALARALNAVTPIGAQLDSIADTLLFFTTIGGAVVFFPDELRAHATAFSLVPAAWLIETAAALLRYGRLSSFHTYLSRAGAVGMGAFIVVLFVRGLRPWLLYLASGLVLLATLEELVLLWLLPVWTRDVRGVYWVLRSRSQQES